MAEFSRCRIGPVVMKDEIEYQREVNLLQEISVTLQIAGLSTDGSHFIVQNEILRLDGKLCGRVRSTCGWLDLANRKFTTPPEALLAALNAAVTTSDFVVLPTRIKDRA